MKKLRNTWLQNCTLLALLLLLLSPQHGYAQPASQLRMPIPRPNSTGLRRLTHLTSQHATAADRAPVITLTLATADGLPIPNALIVITGKLLATEQTTTATNGQAQWRPPATLPFGDYVWNAVFTGTANLQPAIAVLKIHLAPAPNTPQLTTNTGPPTGKTNRSTAFVASQSGVTKALAAPVAALRSSSRWPALVTRPTFNQLGATMRLDYASLALWGILSLFGVVLPAGYVARQWQRRKPQPAPLPFSSRWSRFYDGAWRLPLSLWYSLRLASLGVAFGLAVILLVRPTIGLAIFWRLLIPSLPLLFFVAPGLWRNICPMATLNQTPRLFHFTRSWSVPTWFQRYGYLIAISLFLLTVASRKVLFNQNGPALVILILCALGAAFVMGFVFKGKSGWCSSICPLLPVQRIYGQTPFVTVTHAHCEPCLGCTKNCYDLSPRNAYLADLYDGEPYFSTMRKGFVGFFPGFVLAFYLVPDPPAIAIWQLYLSLFLSGSVTMGLLFFMERASKALRPQVTSNRITVWFGAMALNLYYWFNAPTLGAWLATPAPLWFVWPLRALVFGLTLFWIYRTYRKETSFIEFTLTPLPTPSRPLGTTGPDVSPTTQGSPQPAIPQPRLTIEPTGTSLPVEPNRTLLELCERHNLPIEAGCRMGLCGADPVCIVDGMANLSKIGEEERKTLERLGLAPNTRLACMARVRGDVRVVLTPERPDIYRSSVISGFRYNKQVEQVVIIGNGIAGVTAADHLRRRHPHCKIHLIGRERYQLYNRMGITRLLYGRSAMQGLMLLPEQWYEDFNITCWLNTQVSTVDPQAQVVTLGTGETLPYDRLILTTGSQSYVPPLAGFGMAGSFVLRTAEDAMAIRAYVQAQSCRAAIVAGGGLLGLEAAYGLHQLGLQVTVLERSPALLTRQLDAQGSIHLLAHLQELGITVLLQAEAAALQAGATVAETAQASRLQQLTLTDGQVLPCDLLLVAAGIRPELDLARTMGLTIRRGVLVDEQMRTSVPHIFAAGDVAEFKGNLYGLWPVAVSQAEVAATNAVAADAVVTASYVETPPVTMLKVVGVDLTSIGRIVVESPLDLVIVHEENDHHRYRKLIICEQRIVGAILLGYPELAPGVTEAVKAAVDISAQLAALQAGDWTALQSLA